jgi:hypothetical protein
MENKSKNQSGVVIELHGRDYDPDPELGMTALEIRRRRELIVAERTRIFFRHLDIHDELLDLQVVALPPVDTTLTNVIPFPAERCRT